MSKKNVNVENDLVYHFCGNGQGIPGLPSEVTRLQAQALGLLDHLTAALQRGDYRPISAAPDGDGEEPKGE